MQNLVLTEGYDFEEQFLEFNTDLWMENTRFMEKLDEVAGNSNFFGEAALHENVFKSAWEYIKRLVVKAKEWIIKTWNKFWDWLTAFFRSNKSFVQKYKNDFLKQAKELDSDFEMSVGVDMMGNGIDGNVSEITSLSKSVITKLEFDVRTLDSTGKVEDKKEEFDDMVSRAEEREGEYFTKTTITGNDIAKLSNTIIDILSNGSKIIKELQKMKDNLTKTFDAVAKMKPVTKSREEVDGVDSTVYTDSTKDASAEQLKVIKSNITNAISASNKLLSIGMSCIKRTMPICRKIVLKVIAAGHNAKYKKNTAKESTMFDFNYNDNVDFIF